LIFNLNNGAKITGDFIFQSVLKNKFGRHSVLAAGPVLYGTLKCKINPHGCFKNFQVVPS